jgi:hypothetical protein
MTRPLRIFLCCQQDLESHPIPAYRFWAGYFRSAFAEAGHACLEAPGCDWAAGLVLMSRDARTAWLESTWQRAVDWIRAEHARQPIDLFLSYLYPEQVHPGGLSEVRALGIPRVNFFCDNVRMFRRPPREFAHFDLNWVPELPALAMYRKARLPFIHAPMACWVEPKWRKPPLAESLPPTFVGTRDGQRERLFAEAYQLGLQMDLRGSSWADEPISWDSPPQGRGFGLLANQWAYARRHGLAALAQKFKQKVFPAKQLTFNFGPRTKDPCQGDEYWRVLREARISIGVNRVASPRLSAERPLLYSRLRDIEGPMVGAAYLTEYAPGLDELYEIGTEIEVYKDAAELVAKVADLEGDAARRQLLREQGQRRALAEHGIVQTIAKVSTKLGLP